MHVCMVFGLSMLESFLPKLWAVYKKLLELMSIPLLSMAALPFRRKP